MMSGNAPINMDDYDWFLTDRRDGQRFLGPADPETGKRKVYQRTLPEPRIQVHIDDGAHRETYLLVRKGDRTIQEASDAKG